MDKKLFPTCLAVVLCCLFSLTAFSAPVFADECNAPAPEDFRKVSEGPGYVTLAWEPVESGATHLLTVSEVLADGSEVIVQTFDGISAVTKKVEGLKHRTRYKFRIYTRCADGTPSLIPSEVDIITLIIELTLAGRKPVNPQPIHCTGIDYQNPDYEWIGFRLQRVKGDKLLYENYFEFERQGVAGELVSIKRADANNRLVVANDIGNQWPNFITQTVTTLNPMKAAEVDETGQVISNFFGNVTVDFNYGWIETVDLCGTINPGQQPYYYFDVFTANEVEDNPYQEFIKQGQGFDGVKVVNPVQDFLEIVMPAGVTDLEKVIIHVNSLDGKLIKTSEEYSSDGSIWMDMRDIPSGPVFLVLSNSTGRQSFPLIKF
jgi:hypothetical protein